MQVKECSDMGSIKILLTHARIALRSVYESQPAETTASQRERSTTSWLKEVGVLCGDDDMLANANDYGTQIREFVTQIGLRLELAFLRSYRPVKSGADVTKIDPISKKLRKQVDGIVMRVSLLLDPQKPLHKVCL